MLRVVSCNQSQLSKFKLNIFGLLIALCKWSDSCSLFWTLLLWCLHKLYSCLHLMCWCINCMVQLKLIIAKVPYSQWLTQVRFFFWFFLLMLFVMEVSFFYFWVKASRYIFPYAIQTLLRISWIQVHIRLISDCKVLLFDKIIIKELLFAIDKLNWC